MAITFQQDYFRNSAGVKWQILGKFNLDSSYPVGGYYIDPVQVGLSQIDNVVVNDATFGYEYNWDKVNSRLRVFAGSGGAGGVFVGTPAALTGTNAPSAISGGIAVAQVFTGAPAALTGTNAPSGLVATADAQIWTAGAYTPTGTNSNSLVSGTANAQVFAGVVMPNHSHDNQAFTQSGTYTLWRIYHGAVVGGPFQIGETVTDPSGNTGVVSAVTADHLDFSAYLGFLDFDGLLTGGTSGATATTTSHFLGVVTALNPVASLVAGAGTPFVPLTTSAFPLVAIPEGVVPQAVNQMRYNRPVNQFELVNHDNDGGFNDGYSLTYVTPATTSVTAGIPSGVNLPSALSGASAAPQVFTGTAAALTGTNALSTVSGTATGQVWTSGAYTPSGTNISSAVTGTADAQIWTSGPYTPAGIIMGGGGPGGAQVEIAPGTNLSTVIDVQFNILGL